MMSISNDRSLDVGDRILEAAADCVVAFGVGRVTLAEIARRAGVSRPTVYRRWPDTQSVLAALLTEQITGVLADVPLRGQGREAVVNRVVALAQRLRADDLISSVLHAAPELAMVYIADRLGTSQQILIDALASDLRVAQRGGSVRAGNPRRLAAMVLLITQSTIQSAQIVAPILDADALAAELSYALNRYLS
ncbi:MAG: helix-turn-helix domain-containing protein [Mycobacterium sp.]